MRNTTLIVKTGLVLLSINSSIFGQTFLNGSFEATTTTSCQLNLSNSDFNYFMPDCYAFGSASQIDIFKNCASLYGVAQDGDIFVGIATNDSDPANPRMDAFSLKLSTPLVAGSNYTVSFYNRKHPNFTTNLLEIGYSTDSVGFGNMINTAPHPSISWGLVSFSFTPIVNSQYITVRAVVGNHGWNLIDNFTISQNGCSFVTSTINHTACGSYTWTNGNGQTYTSSTTATHTIVGGSYLGCDSIITLHLTINQPTTHIITETACESYTLNSQTYTLSGTYTQTLTNANNCDSTITLNLTINQPVSSTINHNACDSYIWTNGSGQTYTSSTTATHTIPNGAMNGCDSTITLHLTITHVDNTVSQNGTTLTANQSGATYQWLDCDNNTPIAGTTNQTFTALSNGNYAVELTMNGCVDTSSCIAVQGIGVNENEPVEVNVFPNPSDGVFTVMSELLENATIEIFTSSGKLLTQYKNEDGETFNIDLSEVPAGVYLLKISNNESHIVRKLIKK